MHKEDKAILSTFIETFKSFQLKPIPQVTLKFDPEATTFITGINDLFFNAVCIKNPINQNKLISELKNIQNEYSIPLTIWITHETSCPSFELVLKEHFQSPGPFFGMLLELEHAKLTCSPQNISIEQIHDELQAKEFAKIYCEIFHLNVLEESEKWVISEYEKDNPTCINYIAKIDGKIAGISSLTVNRTFNEFQTGGFYNACVLPQFRKQGVATAMSCHRVQAAKELGFENLSIVLMSDAMARGYCEQLGFENFKTMTPYFIK